MRIGLIVLADVAMSNTHRDAFRLSPTEHSSREESYVGYESHRNSRRAGFSGTADQTTMDLRLSRARQHAAAEPFHFTCKESWVGSESAEVKLEEIAVNILQNV